MQDVSKRRFILDSMFVRELVNTRHLLTIAYRTIRIFVGGSMQISLHTKPDPLHIQRIVGNHWRQKIKGIQIHSYAIGLYSISL